MLIHRNLPVWYIALATLAFLPTAMLAQTHSRAEFFVGFSGRTGSDPVLRGWNVSAAVNVSQQLAVVADFSGHYGSMASQGFFP